MKKMTALQAKQVVGEAMCRTLGIPVERTKTGQLTRKTLRLLNAAGYYWFPSERTWKHLG